MPSHAAQNRVPLHLQLFALDTTSCAPCASAVASLHAAAVLLNRELGKEGYLVATRVVRLKDADHARALGVLSSPTVRVDGVDVALELDESPCPSCSDLAGAPVACRTYEWDGRFFDHPPAALIAAAVRRHIAAGLQAPTSPPTPDRGTSSVERFFTARTDARG